MTKKKKAKPHRRIVACFADTHAGHKLGLMPPDTVLYDEDEEGNLVPYKPRLTATQKYLWRCYEDDLDNVSALAGGDPIILIHDGDITHGLKYPSQLVGTREADQYIIACGNMRRALQLPNITALRLMQGTASHTFGEGTAPIIVARQLGAEYSDIDIKCPAHVLLDVDGVVFDVSHHGPGPGSRSWLAGNILRYYTRSIMLDELADGEKPPDVVMRAHFHTLVIETVRLITKRGIYTTEAFVLPSYCGLSEHGRQVTRSTYRISCGLVAIEIVGGKIAGVHPFWRINDLRTREKL
jgi:hypothetical protein